MTIDIIISQPANADPQSTSREQNALFYGFSRLIFLLGIACQIMSIFFGNFTILKGILSGSNLRIIARSIVIAGILEVLMIELLYCSMSIPDGMYVTLWICMVLGFGTLISTTVVSVLYMAFIEYPFTVCTNYMSKKWL